MDMVLAVSMTAIFVHVVWFKETSSYLTPDRLMAFIPGKSILSKQHALIFLFPFMAIILKTEIASLTPFLNNFFINMMSPTGNLPILLLDI